METPFPAMPNLLLPHSANPEAPGIPRAGKPPPALPSARNGPPALERDAGLAAEADFLRLAYQRSSQVTVAVQMRQAAAQFAAGSGAAAGAAMEQLQFDFFAESRAEELLLFNRESARIADSLWGARRAAYVGLSQQLAVRFEMSLSISGAALRGFNGAAGLALENNALFDKFLAAGKQLLEAAVEAMNEMLARFDGLAAREGGGEDFVARIRRIFSGMLEDLLAGFGPLQGLSGHSGGIQLEFRFAFSAEWSLQAEVFEADPIVLDLTGTGFNLTSYKDGARFDLLGDGRQVRTGFVTGGDAFLAIDRNGDGIINDGTELFGDQRGAANGFEELRKLDSNGDGVIDSRDRDFDKLLLWVDNGNGITEPGELFTLREAGIAALHLDYKDVNIRAAGGNRLTQLAYFSYEDGRKGRMGDVMLNYTV